MASSTLKFNNLVAVVTGSGGGIGRCYALEFARRGASVIVNDLGSSCDGKGHNQRAADAVVHEIKNFGGNAVANYDSVVEASQSIIDCALSNFGKIDILVNNAGILRDKSFARISDNDWDKVQDVHLKGAFLTSRAAWPHMKANSFGRILMTTSGSGLYGNFGQANYSAAKMALVGLARTLAVEGARNNICCNAIAPLAASRMTQSLFAPELAAQLSPEWVAPLVLYLCHPECDESGSVFEVAAGWAGKLRWQRSGGAAGLSDPERVLENWQRICGFEEDRVTYPANFFESTQQIMQSVAASSKNGKSSQSEATLTQHNVQLGSPHRKGFAKLIGTKFPDFQSPEITAKDAILYALTVGASVSPHSQLDQNLSDGDLRFVYEAHPDFQALPGYYIILSQQILSLGLISISSLYDQLELNDDSQLNLAAIVHGEHELKINRASPSCSSSGGAELWRSVIGQSLLTESEIVEALDKRSGVSLVLCARTYLPALSGGDANAKRRLIAENTFTLFFKGANTVGCDRAAQPIRTAQPSRVAPSISAVQLDFATDADLAVRYRLNGDLNPLHIDPQFAKLGGFDTPIAHGLCSLGIAMRLIQKWVASSDMNVNVDVESVKVRFSRPVLPGQTLRVIAWQSQQEAGKSSNIIEFEVRIVETGQVCISNAQMSFTDCVHLPPQNANIKIESRL